MEKILLQPGIKIIFGLSLLVVPFIAGALSSNSGIQIKKVVITKDNKNDDKGFSLAVSLNNNYKTLNDWQFGFYMPRSFRQYNTKNTKLDMKICDTRQICSKLTYQKAKFTAPDLSTVYTTILKPQTAFALLKGKTYKIFLAHNSFSIPQNYSSLPQSFFIASGNAVINLATTPSTYELSYNSNYKNLQDNLKQIKSNWENSTTSKPAINLIPTPTQVAFSVDKNGFELGVYNQNNALLIHNLSGIKSDDLLLWQKALQHDLGIRSIIDDSHESQTGIFLRQVSSSEITNAEAYKLQITGSAIAVSASSRAGFFYALQTLRQLWFEKRQLMAMVLADQPKFKYRGISLDVARHYFTIDELKNFIDIMASAKLNTLHLHLSDDEAFRLQLDNYGQLVQVGAIRGYGNLIGPLALVQKNLSQAASYEELPIAASNYGGYYSKGQIQDLIRYANLRQITIIPEIDIPGHSRAMIKALPDLFYDKQDKSEYSGYGDNSLPVCAYGADGELGENFTYGINNVLIATARLFARQNTVYALENEISIGGDEVAENTWRDAPLCQVAPWSKMDAQAKEHYFLSLLGRSLKKYRIKLSGWHEFVLNDNALGQWQEADNVGHVWVWASTSRNAVQKAVTLANANFPVVLDYADYLYFDMTYTAQFAEPGLYWATRYGDTYQALNSAFAINSTLQKVNERRNIVGIEGALWTDVIASYHHLQYMALPKLAGLAEASWSDGSYTSGTNLPNWQSLAMRLGCGKSGFLAYLNHNFAAYYRGYPNGIVLEAPAVCHY